MARRKKLNYLKDRKDFQITEDALDSLKIFLIACEGESTEPKYLRNLLNIKRNNKSIAFGSHIIIANHDHSDPYGVLQDLLSDPNYNEKYERWIVIDRDADENLGKGSGGHSKDNFEKAIKEAHSRGISVAWSNPCFELWILLHFKYRDTSVFRADIQTDVLKILQKEKILKNNDGIGAMKSYNLLYEKLQPYLPTAIKNSKKLAKINKDIMGNPCTLIHELLEKLK